MSQFVHIILAAFLTLTAAASISAAPDLPPGAYGVYYTRSAERERPVRSVLQVIRGTACKLEVDPAGKGALRCTEEVSIASVDKRDGIAIVKNKENIFKVDVKYCKEECSGDVLSFIQPIEGYEFHRRSGTVRLRPVSASEGKKNSDLPFEFKTGTIQACIAKEDKEYDLQNFQLQWLTGQKHFFGTYTFRLADGPTNKPKYIYMENDCVHNTLKELGRNINCLKYLAVVLQRDGSVKIKKHEMSLRSKWSPQDETSQYESEGVLAFLCSKIIQKPGEKNKPAATKQPINHRQTRLTGTSSGIKRQLSIIKE